jgi:branched-chain amino acid transport system ATP-binding protein
MSGEPILKIDNLDVHYGDLQAVWDVSLTVEAGQIIAIIGANGAGKSTTLRSVAGLIPPSKGRIEFMGTDITDLKSFQIVAEGISMVPEGRRIFPGLTVKENLLIGAYTPRARKRSEVACQKVFNLFPILGERANQMGTNLSGGEQQMLAVGRALMSEPN